jgi:hypothetical protein
MFWIATLTNILLHIKQRSGNLTAFISYNDSPGLHTTYYGY